MTLIFLSVTMLNEEMVNILLNNGADVNIGNGDKKTALMLLEGKYDIYYIFTTTVNTYHVSIN